MKLVALQEEKKGMFKKHEEQINALVAQINELKVKQENK